MDDIIESLVLIPTVVFLSGVILFLVISPFLIDKSMSAPADNRAMEHCKNKGYETFVTYSRKPFSKTPYAITCGSMTERMLYEQKVNGYFTPENRTIVVVGNKK